MWNVTAVHNEITFRSLENFIPKNTIQHAYKNDILDSPSFAQAGSFFPDWGYNCLGNNQQSEDAHWPSFIKEAVNYIRDTYPVEQFHTSQHVKGLISFVFAIMSHGVADVKWHSLNGLSDYFISAMANVDFHENYQEAHTAADAGAEFTLRHSNKLSYLNETWQVPIRDLVEIYRRLYATKPYFGRRVPLQSHIQYCMAAAFAASKVDIEFGQFMFGYYGSKSPFLTEEMYDYHKGGVEDLSGSVSDCYTELIQAFENGATHTWPDALCSDYFYADTTSQSSSCSHPYPASPSLDSIHQQYDPVTGVLTITGPSKEKADDSQEQDSLSPEVVVVTPHNQEKPTRQMPFGQLYSAASNPFIKKCLSLAHQDDFSSMTLTLPMTSSRVGHQVVSGDFNGNRRTDIAISAPYHLDDKTHQQTGAVFILDSAANMIPNKQPDTHFNYDIRNLSQIALQGTVHHGRFGWSMVAIDMNQDGIDDLAVSTPFGDQGGKIDVFFGQAHLGLSKQPMIRIGFPSYQSLPGTIFAAVDINSDGYDDLAVGCPLCSIQGYPQVGVVHIFNSFCEHCEIPTFSQPDISIQNPSKSAYDRFGESILLIKDTLLIGAPGYSIEGKQRVGRVYAFDRMTEKLRWTMTGTKEFQQFGRVLVADNNNDIVAISSPSEETTFGLKSYWQAGTVRVYDWNRMQFHSEVDVTDVDLERGMMSMIKGRTNAGHLGQSLSVFGDNDDNGIWIGEPMSEQENGRVYRWSFDHTIECINNNRAVLARFGSQIGPLGTDAICITSQRYGQNAR
ncbi:Phosphatidylinositol-glycan-specific phospholipase D [Choanephora cucurbitarum]|uniref:Phosphatidylinositol-glycan-specific phospholipase D n=1 Tax=Choanephora cucurbitarum TaxID=101091 RepID=A0A1C7NFH8_9FUNG|nr:Phosphatidylinositol-glycan-specific phospholipase D [Choanephora cucurbitarum]